MGSQPYTADDIAEIQKAGDVFRYKFDIWIRHGNGRVLIKGKPVKRSQSSFGKLIYPCKKNPQAQISKWYNGKSRIPSDMLDKIVDIFNNDKIPTTKDEFRIHNDEEYRYNRQTVNEYIEKHYGYMFSDNTTAHMASFCLFLMFMKSLSFYDEKFPLWTKIILQKDPMFYGPSYVRAPYSDLPDAATSDYLEFQVNKGKCGVKVLRPEDISFLMKVHRKVSEYIETLFLEHKDELDDYADNANLAAQYRHEKLTGQHVDDPPIDECQELTEEEMLLVDPYHAEAYFMKHVEHDFPEDFNTDEMKGDDK